MTRRTSSSPLPPDWPVYLYTPVPPPNQPNPSPTSTLHTESTHGSPLPSKPGHHTVGPKVAGAGSTRPFFRTAGLVSFNTSPVGRYHLGTTKPYTNVEPGHLSNHTGRGSCETSPSEASL